MEGKVARPTMEALNALTTTPVLVGTVVNGKPNLMVIAWCSPAKMSPPSITITSHKSHLSNTAIHANKSFSISLIPATEIVRADHCGLKSGREADKSGVFKTVPGKVTGAPLLPECPVTFECTLTHSLDLGTHEIFVGKVESVFVSGNCIEADKLSSDRLNATLFNFMGPSYHKVGEKFASPWHVGMTYNDDKKPAAKGAIEPFPHVDKESCVGCGTCVGVCPHEMYTIGTDGKAHFADDKESECTRCGECVSNCPATAIQMKPL